MIERKYVEYELAKGKKDICIVCNCKNLSPHNKHFHLSLLK